MNPNRKVNTSIFLSLGALFVALIPVYLEFGRSIGLDIVVSESAYISNTIGGVPDAQFSFALRANGPSSKAIAIRSIKITLKNTNTNVQHVLMVSSKSENFPLILNGGDVVTRSDLFIVNRYLQQEINENDEWLNRLRQLVQDETDLRKIEMIRRSLKKDYIPIEPDDHYEELSDYIRILPEEIDEQISNIIEKISIENLQRILFFMPGSYEMTIEALDPFDRILATHKRQFSIDATLSRSLHYKFNVNLRVHTLPVNPT